MLGDTHRVPNPKLITAHSVPNYLTWVCLNMEVFIHVLYFMCRYICIWINSCQLIWNGVSSWNCTVVPIYEVPVELLRAPSTINGKRRHGECDEISPSLEWRNQRRFTVWGHMICLMLIRLASHRLCRPQEGIVYVSLGRQVKFRRWQL